MKNIIYGFLLTAILANCNRKPDPELLKIFNPSVKTYSIRGKNKTDTIATFSQIELITLAKENDQSDVSISIVTNYKIPVKWQTFNDTIYSNIGIDNKKLALAFPSPKTFPLIKYIPALEVDLNLKPGDVKNQTIAGLKPGILSEATGFKINRKLRFIGFKTLMIENKQYVKCRYFKIKDLSKQGNVEIDYWFHPEFGFVKAIYQTSTQSISFSLR